MRTAAAAAAVAVAASLAGDLFLVAALLGIAGREPTRFVVALLAATATTVRWGSSSLEAVAGAQAVLGPAGVVGRPTAAAAAWCAAVALLLAAPRGGVAIAYGVAAGMLVAGPAGGGGAGAGRLAAALGGVALAGALGLTRGRLEPVRRWAAVAVGAAACLLAVAA